MVDFPQTLNYRGAIFAEIGPGKHASATEGVLIEEVRQGSAAWTAGLRQGDAVTSINFRSQSIQGGNRSGTAPQSPHGCSWGSDTLAADFLTFWIDARWKLPRALKRVLLWPI